MGKILGAITLIAAGLLYAYGWVMNIINLINGSYNDFTVV